MAELPGGDVLGLFGLAIKGYVHYVNAVLDKLINWEFALQNASV